MSEYIDLTVIIPVHKMDEVDVPFFNNAIESIKKSTVKPKKIIITTCNCPGTVEFLEKFDNNWDSNIYGETEVEIVKHDNTNDFCSQINHGSKFVKTKYFSILEFDDEYTPIWFKNFSEYEKHYPEVKVFLPMVVDVNTSKEFLGFTNEAAWAMGFSDKLGFLDENALLKFPNFQTSGAIIDKEMYEEMGGLKPSMKLTFVYEFLLRLARFDVKIMTIPRVGYLHTNMRENSLFWDYKHNPELKINGEEANHWLETAKKEYYYKHERDGVEYEG